MLRLFSNNLLLLYNPVRLKRKKENVEEGEKKDEEEVVLEDDVITPTNEISATLQEPPIEDLTKQLDQTIQNFPQRRSYHSGTYF